MEDFLKTWLRHAPALAVVMAIVLGLEHFGILQPVESMGIDRFVRVFPAEESKDIFGGIAYPAHKYGRVIYEAA